MLGRAMTPYPFRKPRKVSRGTKEIDNRVISRYVRGGYQMAQVVIHRGIGSNRRSETRHVQLSSLKDGEGFRRVWVGNNPDPTTISRRENAARVLANASAAHVRIEMEISDFEKILKRDLTEAETEMFKLHGLTSEAAKKSVEKVVIPALKRHLKEAEAALEQAKTHQAEVNDAFPLQVEFVGL